MFLGFLILLPITARLFATWVAGKDLALLGFQAPVLIVIILLELFIYWQHRFFYVVPSFWSLYKVHHSDKSIDASTVFRFHAAEIVLSMLVKFAAIILFSIPVIEIVIFEIVLNATVLFNHSNIKIPFDNILRLFVVMPDMHQVHHSLIAGETNSNYGFNVPWWDRIFGRYVVQPEQAH